MIIVPNFCADNRASHTEKDRYKRATNLHVQKI